MISDIAEQTNLLALNATIEAARAGEAAGLILASSSNLSDQADHLKEQMDKFISAVRAG